MSQIQLSQNIDNSINRNNQSYASSSDAQDQLLNENNTSQQFQSLNKRQNNQNKIYKYSTYTHSNNHKFKNIKPIKKLPTDKHPQTHKESQTQIDYNKGIDQYLKDLHNDNQDSIQKTQKTEKDEEYDRQVQSIIKEVLDKRKKMSRLSNSSGGIQNKYLFRQNNKTYNQYASTNIQKVNKRLRKQNEQLVKNIKNIMKKIKKYDTTLFNFNCSLNSTKINQNMSKNISSKSNINIKVSHYPTLSLSNTNSDDVMSIKQKQLQKLRRRLNNAERANLRMQGQLSKIYQSRRSLKKQFKDKDKNNTMSKLNVENNICLNCQNYSLLGVNSSSNSKKYGKQKGTQNSPQKKYYSPIMQFSEYNLRNEPTISLSQQSLQKTSQFGFQLQPVQIKKQADNLYDKFMESQRQIQECLKLQKSLEQQITQLQKTIKNNNKQISRYETILLKQLI